MMWLNLGCSAARGCWQGLLARLVIDKPGLLKKCLQTNFAGQSALSPHSKVLAASVLLLLVCGMFLMFCLEFYMCSYYGPLPIVNTGNPAHCACGISASAGPVLFRL